MAPMICVEELDVGGSAIVAGELEAVAQGLGAGEDVAFVEMVEDFGEFALAEGCALEGGVVVDFKLLLQIGVQRLNVVDLDAAVAEVGEAVD